MAKDYFDFQQFRVYHDKCAMKVGTDGVLLGAWGSIGDARRVLDVGTGSGLIALMVAQRSPEAHIDAIDVEESAVQQATENARISPFADRIVVKHADVREYECTEAYDAVFCNPPYYPEDTLPPDTGRALARNSALLPFSELVKAVCRLMAPKGVFSACLPMQAIDSFVTECLVHDLYPFRQCNVQTVARKHPKRVLVSFSFDRTLPLEITSIILQEGDKKSEAYLDLARGFYLEAE